MSADPIDLTAARVAERKRQVLAGIAEQLSKTEKGYPHGSVSNLILIVAQDPALAGLVGLNEFTGQPMIFRSPPSPLESAPEMAGPYPRPWNRADVSFAQTYVQRVWTQAAGREDTEDALLAVAHMHRFHPVRDWLATLKWDGRKRLDLWLPHCFGADDTPYVRAVGAKTLIAAVRRVRQPGCKFDHLLILEGEQDLGKSTCIRELASPAWFTDSLPAQIDSKDMAIALHGIWIAELPEIEQIIRADVEVIKAFLARMVDRYRPPYARADQDFPRQGIFFGTTNASDYLRDPTGNRRFWPIRCIRADVPWIVAAREQLWAEAARREQNGEIHWLEDESLRATARAEQAERLADDTWSTKIWDYIGIFNEAIVADVLADGVGIKVPDQQPKDKVRVTNVLRAADWFSKVQWRDGRPVRVWHRPRREDALTPKQHES